jgi:hypothetical protein
MQRCRRYADISLPVDTADGIVSEGPQLGAGAAAGTVCHLVHGNSKSTTECVAEKECVSEIQAGWAWLCI